MNNANRQSSLNSAELVDRVRHNDAQAANELCRRYLPRLLQMVRLKLGPKLRRKMDSMDIVQDVMMQVFTRDFQEFEFSNEHALIRYLAQILQNELCDKNEYLHRKKRDVNREQQLADEMPQMHPVTPKSKTPSQIVSLQEDFDRMAAAMDQLRLENPDYWNLIYEVEFEERPIVDLANELNESPDAVRMRLKRAKLKLAEIFKRLPVSLHSPEYQS
jgi:RNA polymerase sigma-70 factor (ECF subfamily)